MDGWSFSPIITWQRHGGNYFYLFGGTAQVVNGGQCASFGEADCSAAYTDEAAILATGYTGGSGIVRNSTYGFSNGAAPIYGTGMNRFADPKAIKAEFRPIVLGLDTTGAEGNALPGLSSTNVDLSVTKNLALSERFSTTLNAQAVNVFNHFSASPSFMNIANPLGFGVIGGNFLDDQSVSGRNRAVELGLLVNW